MAEAALNLEEYFVTEDCIACDACCNDFPDIFKMNAEHTRAIAVNLSPIGKHNPWEIVTVCPVDAIKLTNLPMPPKPEGEAKKEEAPAAPSDNADWQARWQAVQGQIEPQWERMKRYGMASVLEDEGGSYLLRFELPEKVPNHKLKFKWNLPDTMPDYQCSAEVEGQRVKVRGRLTDPEVLKLCGWVNSFPEGFLREVYLDHPVKLQKSSYDPESRVFEVSLQKLA